MREDLPFSFCLPVLRGNVRIDPDPLSRIRHMVMAILHSFCCGRPSRGEEEEKEEIARLEGGACGVGGSVQRSLVIRVSARLSNSLIAPGSEERWPYLRGQGAQKGRAESCNTKPTTVVSFLTYANSCPCGFVVEKKVRTEIP